MTTCKRRKRVFSPALGKTVLRCASYKGTRRRRKAAKKASGQRCALFGVIQTVRGPRTACARRRGGGHTGIKSPNWVPGTFVPASVHRQHMKARAKAAKAERAPRPSSARAAVAAAYEASTRRNPYAGVVSPSNPYAEMLARSAALQARTAAALAKKTRSRRK